MIYSREIFTKKTKILRPHLLANTYDDDYVTIAIYKDPDVITGILYVYQTTKMMSVAKIKKEKKGKDLRTLNYYQKTPEVLRERLRHRCYEVKFIPDDLLTAELISIAAENGLNFRDIPKHMRSSELALKCVKYHPNQIICIPQKFQTQEIVDLALKNIIRYHYIVSPMKYIANRFKTEENSMIAIQRELSDVCYIPDHLITKEICLFVAEIDCRLIDKLPERFRSMEFPSHICATCNKREMEREEHEENHIICRTHSVHTQH